MTDIHLATIQKNKREVIRIGLTTYNGHRLFGARVWFEADDGEMRPGKAGLAFKAAMLPEFADAVLLALEAARAEGSSE